MDFIENKEVPIKEEKPSVKVTPSSGSLITEKVRTNPWILSTIVLGILSVLLLLGVFNPTSGSAVSENEVGDLLINFYEAQGIQGLEVVSVESVDDFYKVDLKYNGQTIPFYVTKSGYLTGNSIISLLEDFPTDGGDLNNSDGGDNVVQVSVDDDAVKGDPNAPVTIVEFSDYQCPFCGRHFRETLPQIISQYVDTGKVKIVFRDFPLGFHEKAEKAAEAAECAGEFGDAKYWEMHDKLYNNQDALDVDDLKSYAVELGLDATQFNDCLDSDKMADEVQADIDEGSSYGVSGTPAFFINGILVSGAQPFSEFEKIIDAELAKV